MCRTFFYKATEELGAHCFKNRREAIAWISTHFITGGQGAPRSSPAHKVADLLANGCTAEQPCTDTQQLPMGGRREQATFACDLDLLHWAVDRPSADLMEWAAAAAAQLVEHGQCATEHAEEAHKFDEQLPDLHRLLDELVSPRVRLQPTAVHFIPIV